MGLAEKRIAHAMEKDSYPAWKKMVLDACPGTNLEFDVAWSELVKEGFADYYPKNVEHNFFAPLAKALQSICSDELGKDAFAARFKKVHIGSKRHWSSLEAKVETDTLYLDADPSYGKNVDDTRDYADRIQKAIENAL